MLLKVGKPYIYHSGSLACKGHFREEGRYGGGRYFDFPCMAQVLLMRGKMPMQECSALLCLVLLHVIRSPRFGVGRKGSPRFLPICSDFPVFFRFALPVFGNAPICSDLFRFLPICSDLFSKQIRTNQGNSFLSAPFANPRVMAQAWKKRREPPKRLDPLCMEG